MVLETSGEVQVVIHTIHDIRLLLQVRIDVPPRKFPPPPASCNCSLGDSAEYGCGFVHRNYGIVGVLIATLLELLVEELAVRAFAQLARLLFLVGFLLLGPAFSLSGQTVRYFV